VRMYNIDPSDEQALFVALRETVAKAREIGPWLNTNVSWVCSQIRMQTLMGLAVMAHPKQVCI